MVSSTFSICIRNANNLTREGAECHSLCFLVDEIYPNCMTFSKPILITARNAENDAKTAGGGTKNVLRLFDGLLFMIRISLESIGIGMIRIL